MNLSSLVAIALSLVLFLSTCFVCVTMTGRPSEELKNMIVCLYFQSQQGSYFSNAYNATHEDQVDKDGEVISNLHSDMDDVHESVDTPQPAVDTAAVHLRNIVMRLGFLDEMKRNITLEGTVTCPAPAPLARRWSSTFVGVKFCCRRAKIL